MSTYRCVKTDCTIWMAAVEPGGLGRLSAKVRKGQQRQFTAFRHTDPLIRDTVAPARSRIVLLFGGAGLDRK
jgi:hypothetical protein